MRTRHACTARRAGFTLIEVLTVILIISILAAVLVTQLGGATEAAKRDTARQDLAKLEGAIQSYQNEFGACPMSSFTPAQEVSNEGANVGVEALVVALWSKKYEAGGLLEDVRDKLVNTDGDSSPKALTDFGNRELLEIADPWENPVAYIERADYGVVNREYMLFDGETGALESTAPAAFKNPRTGQYFRPQSFQLISAGPDGKFGTEDDITTFERE